MLAALLCVACEPQAPADLPPPPKDVRRASTVLAEAPKRDRREAPPFTLAARDGGVGSGDCSDCHAADDEVDVTPRTLEDAHAELKLAHGGGRIWCLDCHHAQQRNDLVGPRGGPVPIGAPHRACARCHADVERDFRFGVHGRREGSFRGERVLLSCVACHDPHAPKVPPRRPAAGPTPRSDLPPPVHYETKPGRVERVLHGGQP